MGNRYSKNSYKIERNDDKVMIYASISYQGISHERQVCFNFQNDLVVTDKICSNEKLDAVQVWNLPNDKVAIEKKRIQLENATLITNSKNVGHCNYLYSNGYCNINYAERILLEMEKDIIETHIEFIMRE